MDKIIMQAEITAMPVSFLDPMPKVVVTFDDGSKKLLFEFYPDEIRFTTDEFLGLTEEQARHLKFIKDKHYLQS
jgi:hypothetical protein